MVLSPLVFILATICCGSTEVSLLQQGVVVQLAAEELMQVSDGVRWAPVKRGGELHKDVKSEIFKSWPSATHKLLEAIIPDTDCNCALDRFDQYAICQRSISTAKSAFSFGVNGYDPWGLHVNSKSRLVPRLFDCFNDIQPKNFANEFHKVCLGSSKEVIDGRRYETLASLLDGSTPASALLKLDIEYSEYDILGNLTSATGVPIAALNVEYHFNHACPTEEEITRRTEVFRHMKEHLKVVDAAAAYYGPTCFIGGKPFPKLLAVSYSAPGLCSA